MLPAPTSDSALVLDLHPIAPPPHEHAVRWQIVSEIAPPHPQSPPPIPLPIPLPNPAVPPPTARAASDDHPPATPDTAPLQEIAPRGQSHVGKWLGEMPSWLVSLVVHLTAFVIMVIVSTAPEAVRRLSTTLVIDDGDDEHAGNEPQLDDAELSLPDPMPIDQPGDDENPAEFLSDLGPATDEFAAADAAAPHAGLEAMPSPEGREVYSGPTKGELAGRGGATRAELVRAGGGNAASEAAVALALQWIVAHQAADGGWNFDHTRGTRCENQCRHRGGAGLARNGATAMALLPLLGAGNTHKSGAYRTQIDKGIKFLISRQKDKKGSFHEPGGDMYSHGLAAIALCEAFAMTKDEDLRKPAQASLDFIAHAQDPVGGGWRYSPRQPGDTSVVGWQLMALKSGLLNYLTVDSKTVRRAGKFLDHVQSESGARYGYMSPGDEPATSSIGLLCRMYMGWQRDHPALIRGVEFLADEGPSATNMYYNYYATQVLHHFGGESWKGWNAKMRDSLVDRQTKSGHEKGSWHMNDPFVDRGGRLYCTAMAAMILEVYYRHLPIYRSDSVSTAFDGSQ